MSLERESKQSQAMGTEEEAGWEICKVPHKFRRWVLELPLKFLAKRRIYC